MKMYLRVLALFLLLSSSVRAGTVTLRFEAEITDVNNWQSRDFGVDIAIGQRISGQFTFLPVAGQQASETGYFRSATYEQPYSAFLEIDGVRLSTSALLPGVRLTSLNDNFYICDCAAGVSFNPGPFDELHVSSSLGPNESMAAISPVHSFWKLELQGGPKLLDRPDGSYGFGAEYFELGELPVNVATWNSLNSGPFVSGARRLTVGLKDSLGIGILFYADVGQFEVVPVPEPSVTLACCWSLGTCLLSLRNQNRSGSVL